MSDNTRLPVGTLDGDTYSSDDINDGGVANAAKVQRVKVGHGTDGNYKDASAVDPFPVALSPNSNAVTQQALTKGAQGATGVSTQDLKDAGRTAVVFSATAAAAGATTVETAITLVKSAGTGATSSAASFVVTSGKRFRITSITVATRGNAVATAQATTFNLRINTGGAVTTSSTPIILSARCANAATANAYDRFSIPIPDGLEILGDGTLQIGITAAATFVTNAPTWDVLIAGFEY